MRVLFILTLFLIFYGGAMAQEKTVDNIADCQIIRVVEMPLTKKPKVPRKPKIVLLNTCIDDEIPRQRPVIEVIRNGKKEFRTFEVIKVFTDRAEAENYAEENGLTDVDFD